MTGPNPDKRLLSAARRRIAQIAELRERVRSSRMSGREQALSRLAELETEMLAIVRREQGDE